MKTLDTIPTECTVASMAATGNIGHLSPSRWDTSTRRSPPNDHVSTRREVERRPEVNHGI